jgi:hypothetical protein
MGYQPSPASIEAGARKLCNISWIDDAADIVLIAEDGTQQWVEFKDDVVEILIAARAADPPPTMAELDAAIERYRECASELRKAISCGNYVLEERWSDRLDDAEQALRALFARAAGYPVEATP